MKSQLKWGEMMGKNSWLVYSLLTPTAYELLHLIIYSLSLMQKLIAYWNIAVTQVKNEYLMCVQNEIGCIQAIAVEN